MYDKKMPFGNPMYFDGEYQEDKVYDLYIQRLTCSFEIKENMIPTIQIKGSSRFMDNEYLTSSHGEIISLTLTSVDLQLFKEHYNIYDLDYECGWKFKSINGLFTKYIDKWINRKIEASKIKNGGQRTLAKLMLNAIYGKFALNPKMQSKHPIINEKETIQYKLNEEEIGSGMYIPVRIIYYSLCKRKNN